MLLVFLRFLSELGTRTQRTDGRTSNSLIRMRNSKMIRHCWCRLKNVKLSLWLPFNKLTNPAVVLVSDVTGTDWYVTSGRSLSIVRWRQLPFAAEALNYSQIIMTVAFGPRTKQYQIVIARIFILGSSLHYFICCFTVERTGHIFEGC